MSPLPAGTIGFAHRGRWRNIAGRQQQEGASLRGPRPPSFKCSLGAQQPWTQLQPRFPSALCLFAQQLWPWPQAFVSPSRGHVCGLTWPAIWKVSPPPMAGFSSGGHTVFKGISISTLGWGRRKPPSPQFLHCARFLILDVMASFLHVLLLDPSEVV